MKKIKKLILKINPKFYRNTLRNFDVKILDKVISKKVKELNRHFKKDKWPITFQGTRWEILNEAFGQLDFYTAGKLLEGIKNSKIDYTEDMIVVQKKKRRKA